MSWALCEPGDGGAWRAGGLAGGRQAARLGFVVRGSESQVGAERRAPPSRTRAVPSTKPRAKRRKRQPAEPPRASVCARPPRCPFVSDAVLWHFWQLLSWSWHVFVSELWCIPMKMWSDFQVSTFLYQFTLTRAVICASYGNNSGFILCSLICMKIRIFFVTWTKLVEVFVYQGSRNQVK